MAHVSEWHATCTNNFIVISVSIWNLGIEQQPTTHKLRVKCAYQFSVQSVQRHLRYIENNGMHPLNKLFTFESIIHMIYG